MTHYEISAQDNNEDVTELVKHVAEQVEGVTVETKEGGSIRMTGDVKIQMTGGAIKIG
jgi:imidazole glycerol phosphate synthase subunit HisF